MVLETIVEYLLVGKQVLTYYSCTIVLENLTVWLGGVSLEFEAT